MRDIYSERQKPVFRNQLVTLADLELFKTDLLVSIKALLTGAKYSTATKQWLKSYQVKKLLNIFIGTFQNLKGNRTLYLTKIWGLNLLQCQRLIKCYRAK